jgi:N,N-dimethylformamidase beta subunit-like, C-terminal
LGVTGVLGAMGAGQTLPGDIPSRPVVPGLTPVAAENRKTGGHWHPKAGGLRPSQDGLGHVQGYASASSVAPGERLTFHVSAVSSVDVTIEIYRLGYYQGAGSRLVARSPRLPGRPQPTPVVEAATGTVWCPWLPSWTFQIPRAWVSGLYLASFTSSDGRRSCTPFVVRDDRRDSEFLVVLPFTTYQAYNQFPMDGRLGRSLYYGYVPSAHDPSVRLPDPVGVVRPARPVPGHPYCLFYPARARTVSFARPYAGAGIPRRFSLDQNFIAWAEAKGFDLSYATSLDLHEGRVDPSRHRTVMFSGHDEYWSPQMRDRATRAVHAGTHLAFFAANNVYWKVRIGSGQGGFPTVTCYKGDPDPAPDGTGGTPQWRDLRPGGVTAEQGLLGTQFTGILRGSAPLVVSNARHWFWAGTGLADNDRLSGLVTREADGLMKGMVRADAAEQALLSDSPFRSPGGTRHVQNTGVYRSPGGAWVFNAGTFGWTPALGGLAAMQNPRVQRATDNLITRLRA